MSFSFNTSNVHLASVLRRHSPGSLAGALSSHTPRGCQGLRTSQKPNFTPNCRMRGVPCIDVIRPNVPRLRFVAGLPQLKWFKRLNASRRSSTVRLVLRLTFLDNAISIVHRAGPFTLLIGVLP